MFDIITKKWIREQSNEDLLEIFESVLFNLCHKQTKKEAKNLEVVKEELMNRLSRKEVQ
jgi:hypothetical protein